MDQYNVKRRLRSPLRPRLPYRGRPVARRISFLVLAFLAGFWFLEIHGYHRHLLRVKYSPTIFREGAIKDVYRQGRLRERKQDNGADGEILAHRSEWKHLGSGREGDVYTYNGTAIKVYDDTRSPFRNCLPDEDGERWPVEIPATLLLGSSPGDRTPSFISVIGYFFSGGGRWHLITPFYASGTLHSLSKRLHASRNPDTAQELDTAYRPSLNRLLAALGRLHVEHYLCHDDIKPENIFIADSPSGNASTQWLLGDLGNARHLSHPYHSSALWTPYNGQRSDCRANDVLRLLKTYILFLRDSVADTAVFDAAFLDGSEEWSRVYWRSVEKIRSGTGVAAEEIRRISEASDPDGGLRSFGGSLSGPSLRSPLPLGSRYRGSLRRAVTEELAMSLGDKWSKFWGLAALRGIPSPPSCR